MTKINTNFQELANNYLFAETASRKRKYLEAHEDVLMRLAERFQQKANMPYKIRYGAAAVVTQKEIKNKTITGINGSDLNIKVDDQIFLIHGDRLMNLAYNLYERIIK